MKTTMEVTAVTGERKVEIQELPIPRAQPGFALVRIESAPMCTEFHQYLAGHPTSCLGHEAAGTVVDAAGSTRVQEGDRVVVMPSYPCGKCALCLSGDYIHCEQGVDPLALCGSETGMATYAQYVLKQDWLLLPIPDGISFDHASMACCGLGPTFGACQKMAVDAFDTFLVSGLGPVGLGAVVNARFRGARVLGVEGSSYRARLAKELGAAAVIDPGNPDALPQVKDLTGGRGADKAVDCTTVPAAKTFAVRALRRRGQISFIGWGGQIEINEVISKGLTLHGAWHWNLHDALRIFQVIRACPELLDRQVTHRFPLRKVQDAFELQMTGQCGKIILHPWE